MKQNEEEECEEELNPKSDGECMDDVEDYTPKVSQKVVYSNEENNLIRKHFRSMINGSTVLIQQSAVEKIMKSHGALKEMLKKYGIRKILVKVRSERKKVAIKNK